MDKYYRALGKFVDRFSSAEDATLIALRAVAGVKMSEAQALFSGTRTRDAISFIRRLHEVRSLGLPGEIEDAFSQLASINTARDNILHWGVREREGAFEISNELRSHAPRSLKTFPISPDILDAMSEDLGTIVIRLMLFAVEQEGDEFWAASWGPTLGEYVRLSQQPWRYKSASPTDAAGSPQKTIQKPKVQRPPSPS